MRKLLLIASLFIVTVSHAQTRVTKDAAGNYTIAKADTAQSPGNFTGHTITDAKGEKHPVYISAHGKLFWYKQSKSGNYYKVYIKIDTN